VRQPESTSIPLYFSSILVDLYPQAVTELNFDVRDLLKNWLDLIDDGISQTPHPTYRAHLFEFAKVREKVPWDARSDRRPPGTVAGALSSSSFSPFQISAVYTKEMLALTNQLKKQDWDDRNNAISKYFAEQSVYFRDLTDQLHTITEETEEMGVSRPPSPLLQLPSRHCKRFSLVDHHPIFTIARA
jgi:hypothetical protein